MADLQSKFLSLVPRWRTFKSKSYYSRSESLSAAFWDRGYAVLPGAIDQKEIREFWEEFELLRDRDPILAFSESGKIYWGKDLDAGQRLRMRTVNLQNRSPRARSLATHPAIFTAFQKIFGYEPTCIQTLAYSQSSRQGAHSDFFLVSPPWVGNYDRKTLCASWIACEDASEKNGALIIYPGSHTIKKPTLEGCGGDYGTYVRGLDEACRKNNIEPKYFIAKSGDVLLWHGDFVHAGSDPIDNLQTRASLVCHYARLDDRAVVAGRTTFATGRRRYVVSGEEW